MNLALHIIRKDFHRLRWILVLWVLLITAGNLMATVQAHLDVETYSPFRMAALILGAGFAPLTAFGLVMGLVHDDPVAAGDAFWITRPISGGQLLFAKALALALLWLVPVAASFPWWLAFHFVPAQLWEASRWTLLIHFAITSLAVPIAVMSKNASRFVLNVMLAAGILVVFLIACSVLLIGSPGQTAAGAFLLRDIWLTWIGVGVVVALNQFLTRRTRRSVTLAAAGTALAFVRLVAFEQPGLPPEPARMLSSTITAPARPGAHGSAGGGSIKVQDVQLDFEGNFEVALSETEPSSPGEYEQWVLDGRAYRDAPRVVTYALVHPTDRKSLPAQHKQWGGSLDLAGVRYTHTVLEFKAQQVSAAWLSEATLTKIITSAEGQP